MARITPLKEVILKRGLIQADLAERVGISETRMSRIVNGRLKPADYEVKNLANELGLEREELRLLPA